jgi:hypothetical protein
MGILLSLLKGKEPAEVFIDFESKNNYTLSAHILSSNNSYSSIVFIVLKSFSINSSAGQLAYS